MEGPLRKDAALVGEYGCGKESLIWRMSEDVFVGDSDYPHRYEHHVEFDVNGTKIQLYLRNTNPEENQRHHRLDRRWGDTGVVLLCFSIDSQESFELVTDFYTQHEVQHFCPDVPIILVGNKKELRDELLLSGWDQGKEPVTPKQGKAAAKRIGAYAYLECSAKTKEGVREVFETAARAALENRRPGWWKRSIRAVKQLLPSSDPIIHYA